MKCLNRDKCEIKYALLEGVTDILDSEGNLTGEKKQKYSTPVTIEANVSSATGNAYTEQFGYDLRYDKVLLIDSLPCPIDEYTALYIDNSDKPDYIVVRVAESPNIKSCAIRRAEISID